MSDWVTASLEKREKRFFAHCYLGSGEKVVAHCPNSGSMKGNALVGSPVWLKDFGADHLEQGRKLRYKWVMVESDGVRVVVDTHSANAIVGAALREGKIAELKEYTVVQPEKKVGASRIDFYLPGSPDAYVEVKSVSMGVDGDGAFPDAVTERGQKHIRELMALKKQGHRAVLFFLLVREEGKSVRIAAEIDPEYDRLLKQAIAEGVEVLAYGIEIIGSEIRIGKRVAFV